MNIQDFRIHDTEAGFSLIRKSRAPTNPERHFHSSYELFYMISGERTFFYGKDTFSVKAGDFLCIKPGVLHRGLNKNKEICELFNVYFDDSTSPYFTAILPLLLALTESGNPVLSLRFDDRSRIQKIFTDIALELDVKKAGYIQLVWSLLFRCLVEMVRYVPSGSDSPCESAMNGKIRDSLDWLAHHFREPVTLKRIAEKFDISETYFSRLFRSTTHFSFIEYLNALRVQEACRLLRSTRKTATEISLECGFGSVTQFGRRFRKITGGSPLSYRKGEA